MILLRLIALILFLVAFLCGGCSIFFAQIVAADSAWIFLLIGFVPAGLLVWAGIALWRKPRNSAPPPTPDDFR
ncbi:hypothetical protein NX862_02085 [Rhodobacter sp. KR11]|uniref:hypothetical protein n=1 Tax=Rhodobacter sp. KR11 TaxID=2974588 RepID=UPI002221ACCF|nr:hypothetical protein [Rhodobacter sp. KR11]MCW1917534.1 hypothetical protein [Rhodobacter sp. KR11]